MHFSLDSRGQTTGMLQSGSCSAPHSWHPRKRPDWITLPECNENFAK